MNHNFFVFKHPGGIGGKNMNGKIFQSYNNKYPIGSQVVVSTCIAGCFVINNCSETDISSCDLWSSRLLQIMEINTKVIGKRIVANLIDFMIDELLLLRDYSQNSMN